MPTTMSRGDSNTREHISREREMRLRSSINAQVGLLPGVTWMASEALDADYETQYHLTNMASAGSGVATAMAGGGAAGRGAGVSKPVPPPVRGQKPVATENVNPLPQRPIIIQNKSVNNTADPKNLRSRQLRSEMNNSQIRRMAKKMKDNGYTGEPIDIGIVDGKMIIIDGQHRAAAAARASINEVPINVIPLNEAQKTQLLMEMAETLQQSGRY